MITDAAWSAVVAIVSYAIGTTQFLVVDWRKNRREHERQLRLLRSDLRRLASFDKKFNLKPLQAPDTIVPSLPVVSSAFVPTVAAMDWKLTDEHSDDNAQEAMLGIEDAIRRLTETHAHVFKRGDELSEASGSPPELAAAWDRVFTYAEAYDSIVDTYLVMVRDAVREMNRRLKELGFWRQVRRTLWPRLPKGENPPPITGPNDPRVIAQRAEK